MPNLALALIALAAIALYFLLAIAVLIRRDESIDDRPLYIPPVRGRHRLNAPTREHPVIGRTP